MKTVATLAILLLSIDIAVRAQSQPVFTAAPGSPFAVGKASYPYSAAVGDFNGDGFQDLATVNVGGNNVAVLLGSHVGGFTESPNSPFAVGSTPVSVAVGDFNGDGFQDLATANSG